MRLSEIIADQQFQQQKNAQRAALPPAPLFPKQNDVPPLPIDETSSQKPTHHVYSLSHIVVQHPAAHLANKTKNQTLEVGEERSTDFGLNYNESTSLFISNAHVTNSCIEDSSNSLTKVSRISTRSTEDVSTTNIYNENDSNMLTESQCCDLILFDGLSITSPLKQVKTSDKGALIIICLLYYISICNILILVFRSF